MKKCYEMSLMMRSLLLIVMSSLLLAGCYKVSEYSGDGELIDNGISAATDRYVLNLGVIDLSQSGTKSYRIANLPEVSFVAGIEISVVEKDRAIIEKRSVNPTILLELSDVKGEVVFAEKSKLTSWAWSVPVNESRAFIYTREQPGTYFQSLLQSEYTLMLTVLEPDTSKLNYTASLLAKSGGWK